MKSRKLQNRKQEILVASLTLFTEKGYQETTMADISNNVEIARTTLYEYFQSKQDILFELLENALSSRSLIDPEKPPMEQLTLIALDALERLEQHYTLYRILFKELPSLEKQTQQRILKWQSLTLGDTQTAIRKGFQEDHFASDLSEADVLFSFQALLAHQMSLRLFAAKESNRLEDTKRIIRLFQKGTCKKEVITDA